MFSVSVKITSGQQKREMMRINENLNSLFSLMFDLSLVFLPLLQNRYKERACD